MRLLLLGVVFLAAAAPQMPREVAPGLFVREGVMEDATTQNRDAIANIGFIVGQRGVAVIDPGGSLDDGIALRAAIRQRTSLPVLAVIFTHEHPDHIFGAAAFIADRPAFWGSARLPAELAARGAYWQRNLASLLGHDAGSIVPPDHLVRDGTEQTIDLGGRVLTLRAWPPAHSETDLTVYDGKTKSLWAGDLVFVGRVPSLDGDLPSWLATLDLLEKIPAERVIPGHGPAAVDWPGGDRDERRYLVKLRDAVRSAISAGADLSKTASNALADERSRWALFDDYNGHNVTVAWKTLEWE